MIINDFISRQLQQKKENLSKIKILLTIKKNNFYKKCLDFFINFDILCAFLYTRYIEKNSKQGTKFKLSLYVVEKF